jgi:predicted nucleic acid-binding protein
MIVLDCSAAMEIVRRTPEGYAFQGLMLEGEEVVVPSLYHAEISNTLWKFVKAGKLTPQQAPEKVAMAQALISRTVPMEDFAVESVLEAARLNHPAYDLFYLILARRTGATLLTMDRKLIQLCEEQGVNYVHPVAV